MASTRNGIHAPSIWLTFVGVAALLATGLNPLVFTQRGQAPAGGAAVQGGRGGGGPSLADAALVREQMKDPNPRMRIQAVRASESLYKAGDRTFGADYRAMTSDADTAVVIQAMLTLGVFKAPDLADVVKAAQATNAARGVKEIGDMLLRPAPPVTGAGTLMSEELELIDEGGTIYESLCFSCHANDGLGVPLAGGAPGAMMAPSLAGSPRVNGHGDYVVNVLLKGITGPLGEGTGSSSDIMLPMGTNTDEWIAAVASYVRSSFGNAGGMITAADVARVRAATASRTAPWTLAELEPALPRRVESQSSWVFAASHNAEAASEGLTTRGWTSGVPQAPGIWFQVELPQATMVTEVEFDSPGPRRRGRAASTPPDPATIPYPRGYQVEVSLDGTQWGEPVVVGKGTGVRTAIPFAPVSARFIRITQTDTVEGGPNVGVANLKIFEAGPGR